MGKGSSVFGEPACNSVAGVLLPSAAVALTKAAQSGNRERGLDIDAAFAPLWELFKAFGSYRVMDMMADIVRLARIAPSTCLTSSRRATTPS